MSSSNDPDHSSSPPMQDGITKKQRKTSAQPGSSCHLDYAPRPAVLARPCRGTPANYLCTGEWSFTCEQPAYLQTGSWPFTCERPDVVNERLLGRDRTALLGRTDVAQLNQVSFPQINLPPDGATAQSLQELDLECALRHDESIKDSTISHDQLQKILLTDGEDIVDYIELVGIGTAPGILMDVTQHCRLTFTNMNRLVFTQVNHSAEVGMPRMGCLLSLFRCCYDRWSVHTWSSFYAFINASQIIDVFVQQTFKTSYKETKCNWNPAYATLCCIAGGTLNSQKDIYGVTQTLADFDQGSACKQKWAKTRYMRHILVIRYADQVNNRVAQATAVAHPGVPTARLYQLARTIEAAMASTATVPTTSGDFGPFSNEPPNPLIKRSNYKLVLFLLLVIALAFERVSPIGSTLMIIGLLIMLAGAMLARRGMLSSNKLTYAQLGGALLYSGGFLLAISAAAFR